MDSRNIIVVCIALLFASYINKDYIILGIILLVLYWKFYLTDENLTVLDTNTNATTITTEAVKANVVNNPQISNRIFQEDEKIYKNDEVDDILKMIDVGQQESLSNYSSPDYGTYDEEINPNDLHNIEYIHKHMGCEGDTALANRMKYLGMQSQLASVNRAAYNKYSAYPWLKDELDENENRDWWESDFLDSQF